MTGKGTHLMPRMGLDLRKLELGVVWVHAFDLLSGRRSQNLLPFKQNEIIGSKNGKFSKT